MKIQVTQRDIDLARKRLIPSISGITNHGICQNCPIALAVKRKTHKSVSVGEKYLKVFKTNCPDYYALPAAATKFIQKFDNKKPVKPFTFETK